MSFPAQNASNNIVSDPDIPYVTTIPGGVFPGKAIMIRGVPTQTGDRFCVDLCCGLLVQGDHQDNKALHLNPRFIKKKGFFGQSDEDIVLNSLINNQWGAEERYRNLLSQNQPFNIRILMLEKYFKIAVNGKHLADFVHRIPYNKITTLFIGGAVRIDVVEFEGTNPDLSAPEINIPTGNTDNLPSIDVIIRKPTVPFVHAFRPGSLIPGKQMTITATPTMRSNVFVINVQRNYDHFLHIRVDFPDGSKEKPAIVRNNCINNRWENEERDIIKFPFNHGITFDLQILFGDEFLTAHLDGTHFFNFYYRPGIKLNECNIINVKGDVTIQKFEVK